VRYERTASFDRDFKKLKPEHKETFKKVIAASFAGACDAWAVATDQRSPYVWPKALRVGELVGARGIMEMTWSFASPDGRATFALHKRDGDWYCTWRRIGDHGVYVKP
jgi:hypothetical protein